MRIKLYENRDFMRRTQIKLMQEEVHIWCIRWKEVIPVFEYYQLMLDQKEKSLKWRGIKLLPNTICFEQ